MKLVAVVGTNVGSKRFEPGERINEDDLTQTQAKYLVKQGLALRVEDGQRLPADVKEAIAAGAADPVVVVTQIDVDPAEGV